MRVEDEIADHCRNPIIIITRGRVRSGGIGQVDGFTMQMLALDGKR